MKVTFYSVFILLILLLYSSSLFGQSNLLQEKNAHEYIYCELVGESRWLSPKINVKIDFGQGLYYKDQRIRDEETGKVKKFNSMIDALNYMGEKGWIFVQAYAITHDNQNVYHYLLKRSKDGIDYIPDTKN